MSGLKEESRQDAKIEECKNIAGCVTLVSFNSSAEPSNIILVMSKPKI